MKDALGNDIIIGNAYGFAKNKSGVNVIKLGTVSGKTATGFASLKIDKEFSSVYNDQPSLEAVSTYQKVKSKTIYVIPDMSTTNPNNIEVIDPETVEADGKI